MRPPKMEQSNIEAMMRKATADAARAGLQQPSMIDYFGVPQNVNELQEGYRRQVLSGQSEHGSFDPPPNVSAFKAQPMLDWLKTYFDGLKQRRR